jgi:hypothetical protein
MFMTAADDSSKSAPLGFIGGAGVGANFLVDATLYTLKTTGCNIVPSPDGADLFFVEQVASVGAVLAIFTWSLITKSKTGTGLPPGPAGLLGSAEGLSFLTVLAGIVVVGLQFGEFGGLAAASCSTAVTKPLSWI